MLKITDHIMIDEADLQESFVRASGPGGQNVNKVASAVLLRFDLRGCASLSPAIKARARKLAGSRLTQEQHILIQSDRFRTQSANRQDARARLAALLAAAVPPPTPRKKTKIPRRSIENRLKLKKQRGLLKSSRRQKDDPS